MKLKLKQASLALIGTAMLAGLAACGGASSDTSAGSTGDSTGHDASSEAIARGQGEGGGSNTVVTITPTAGGTVTSAPDGINCSVDNLGGCNATFARHTHLVLTATPDTGYSFTGYSGACTGTTCQGDLHGANVTVSAAFGTSNGGGGSGAPIVTFTDAVSGPITGGENNLGAYLSIYGSNFGAANGLGTTTKVYIGGVEVGNYRYLGTTATGAQNGLQQIAVQVGNLGLPLGKAQPIKVVVDGVASNVDQTFMPNPGRVLFVSLKGNDSTAVADDINHPWRNLQTPSNGGIGGIVRAGDQIVIRGGNWSDIGFDSSWFRFRYPQQEGTAPTGAQGTGWIQFTAYPGPVNGNAIENVHYTTPNNMRGGIQGANSAYFQTTGDYVVVSNLHMDVSANATNDAAPVNLQYSAGPWRVVNNELGPWPAAIHSLAAGVSGHGDGNLIAGNNIHDIACTGASENHGIYADSGASNWDIGYNWVHNITGGNLLQFYDNVGLAGNEYNGFPKNWIGFNGMKVHHNWMETSGKYGINLADGIVSLQIWNNVIVGSLYSGLRINTTSKNMDVTVAFNTFYDNDRLESGSGNGQVLNTWGSYNPSGTIRIYDNVFAAGPDTYKGSAYYVNAGSSDAYLDFERNLYFDDGYGWSRPNKDPKALVGDPKFNNATGGDLTLAAASPAVDSGTQNVPMQVPNDFTGIMTRPEGGANDLGAFERRQ